MKKIKVATLLIFALVLFRGYLVKTWAMEMEVCGDGGFKSFMSMEKLSKSSPQYNYLINNTVEHNNLRITNDGYYAVALGSYYGVLGDKFVITFANGQQTKVVKVDEKANGHTSSSCYGKSMASDGSVVEVIVSTQIASNSSRPDLVNKLWTYGNAGMVYPEFAETNPVASIEKITNIEVTGESVSQKAKNIEERTFDEQIKPRQGVNDSLIFTLFKFKEDLRPMVLYFPNVSQNRLIFLDTEFTEDRELVQAAFIMYERFDENDLFLLTSSLNVYVNRRVSVPFQTFTGIKGGFLGNEGVTPAKAKETINEFIDKNCLNDEETLIIGHGIRQDLAILKGAGCFLESDVYDTLDNAKIILRREKGLKLSDLLLDAGLVQESPHDAYQDARNLVPVFSHLKLIEDKRKKERGL